MRAKKLLKGAAGSESLQWTKFDWLGFQTMQNMQNYFDWRTGPQLENPKASIVVGPGPFVEVLAGNKDAVKHIAKLCLFDLALTYICLENPDNPGRPSTDTSTVSKKKVPRGGSNKKSLPPLGHPSWTIATTIKGSNICCI